MKKQEQNKPLWERLYGKKEKNNSSHLEEDNDSMLTLFSDRASRPLHERLYGAKKTEEPVYDPSAPLHERLYPKTNTNNTQSQKKMSTGEGMGRVYTQTPTENRQGVNFTPEYSTRPLHERLYASNKTEEPVYDPNAPLHERLYPKTNAEKNRNTQQGNNFQDVTNTPKNKDKTSPESGGSFDRKKRTLAAYTRLIEGLKRGHFDPVGDHAKRMHSEDKMDENHTLVSYEYNVHDTHRYYQIAFRPLDNKVVENYYGKNAYLRNHHLEHIQFVGNNGTNFGMLKSETSGDGYVGSDDKNLSKYEVEPIKYNAQLIDEAKKQIEEEFQNSSAAKEFNVFIHSPRFADMPRKRYNVLYNNCQDYVMQVINRAKKLSTKENPLILR